MARLVARFIHPQIRTARVWETRLLVALNESWVVTRLNSPHGESAITANGERNMQVVTYQQRYTHKLHYTADGERTLCGREVDPAKGWHFRNPGPLSPDFDCKRCQQRASSVQ